MAAGARSEAVELLVEVAQRTESTKSLRLQGALRDAIREGRLRPDDRLPSSRALAADLGWSRNVVVDAYDQLLIEGYVTSRVGHGTRIAHRGTESESDRSIDARSPRSSARTRETAGADNTPAAGTAAGTTTTTTTATMTAGSPTTVEVDLEPGTPDLAAFPASDWKRSLADAVDSLPSSSLGYGDRGGAPVLQRSLARYLARVRAADLAPHQILVVAGVSAGLQLLARTLRPADRALRVAVEDPGAHTQWDELRSIGCELIPVTVDDDGLDPADLDRVDADLLLVTPAHQYPHGGVLAPARRHLLVDWARTRPGRLIVEDDYDAEFRYDRRPVGSMQGIAPDVVATTSSLSKTMAPSLRIGWLGVPEHLVAALTQRITDDAASPGVIDQHALAALIDSGRYDRIIRARRTTYRRRRDRMIGHLDDVEGCRVVGAEGGLHLTLLLPDSVDDAAVSARLLERGVFAPPLSRYRMRPGPPGLVASFASASDGDVERFARTLADVLTDRT